MQGLPDFDLTLNPHAGVDDWQYEMRREIQEIIVIRRERCSELKKNNLSCYSPECF